MHCTHDITRAIYDMSSTVCNITFTTCVTSHNDCFYDITHSTFMTYVLYMASHTVLWQHNHCVLHSHYVWYHTQCICVITPNVSISSNPGYVWHHLHYMYVITCNTYDITSTLYDITPLYLWHQVYYMLHHIHYIWPHVHCISFITPNLSMISQPIYVWYHIQYTCDILSTIFMTTYPVCMTSQHCVLMTPHSAYVWHHLDYRWHHIHSITTNHNIHDVTSTSGMTSHPLYQTSHPLYVCHHNLSTGITATFVWHHTHYMCDIMCTIYNITSTAYVITLLYLWQHNLYIWNHIQYAAPYIPYTCDITATNQCHHTHCIDNITPTHCMTSH